MSKHNTQFNTTQVYFNSYGYPYVHATCFGLYLDHPQACKHKNRTQEGAIKFLRDPFLQSLFL